MKNPQQDLPVISFFNRFSGRNIFCKMPIFRTRSDFAWYPTTIGLSGRCLRGNTPQNTAIRRGVILTKNVLQKIFFWEEMMENDTFKCYNGNI